MSKPPQPSAAELKLAAEILSVPIVLPADVEPLDRLHYDFCESKQARPSITEILMREGRVFKGPDGKGELASRADYLAALSQFCARAGINEPALTPRKARKQHDLYAQNEALAEAQRAKSLAGLGFKS